MRTDVKECAGTVFHLCFILRVINGANVRGVVSQKRGGGGLMSVYMYRVLQE